MSCDAAGHTPTKLPAGCCCCCCCLMLLLAVVALSGGRSSRRPATAAADGGPSTRRSSPFLFERRSAYPANACVRERERKRTRTGEREKRRLPSIETFEAERKPAAEVAKQGPTLRCGWWPSLCAFDCFFFCCCLVSRSTVRLRYFLLLIHIYKYTYISVIYICIYL